MTSNIRLQHLRVAYACNDGYIMQTGISLISLFENNRHFSDITIYMISCGITKNNLNEIEAICKKYGRNVQVVDFHSIAYDLNISAIGRHIETIYAKIFFERIGNIDKMLYIDSDTIIAGKLDGIWNTDLTDCYMGMVQTPTGGKAKPKLGIAQDAPFYNDGMALVNVSFCRQNGLIEKCLKVISDFNGEPPVLSEGCLNKVCQGHIKRLSPRYNMMAGVYQMMKLDMGYTRELFDYDSTDLKESFESPVIIHFLSGFYNRSWSKHCTHPLKGEFHKYKAMSPWRDVALTDVRLPLRLRVIGTMMEVLGPRNTERIREIIKHKLHVNI